MAAKRRKASVNAVVCRCDTAQMTNVIKAAIDKVDSRGDLFPETKVADVLEIFGALPEECAALRKASAHIIQLKQNINQPSKEKNISKSEREKTIVAMYNNGHSIDDIWKVSGFSSRSSVFRILNKYGVSLNRGKFSGPLGKRKQKEAIK